jgi:DNA helicase INO80
MSLKNILNHDPLSVHPYSRGPLGDQSPIPDDSRLSPLPSPASHTHSVEPHPSRIHYRSGLQYENLGWDSRSCDWDVDDHTTEPRYDDDRIVSPIERQPIYIQRSDHDSRKRRKGDLDAEYMPAKPRRTSQRKTSQKGKETRPMSPAGEIMDVSKVQEPSREDSRLESSDLEDCRELWVDELDDYILETKNRQQEVAQYFWANILERNSVTALGLSRLYSAKIDRIPVISHTPSSLPGVEDDFENMTSVGIKSNGQDHTQQRRFNAGAEDAALELERTMLQDYPLPKQRSKIDDGRKRGPGSDLECEMDNTNIGDSVSAPANKKRRLDNDGIPISNGVDFSMAEESKGFSRIKGKGKRELSPDSVSIAPRPGRKRPGPKKRVGLLELDNEQGRPSPSSLMGDVTPGVSRPTSPSFTHTPMVYELDEPIPPMKKAKKVDDNAMMKRIKSLEEAQRKVWTNIARRDVAKVYKYHSQGYQLRQSQLERIAKLASIQARKPFARTAKGTKDTQAKAKRLMREMQVFWKKNEKEERDLRKREQKEAMDRLKIEEEKREAARQARKLEFLISQTELYSHFVGSKLKTTEIEGESDSLPVPAGAQLTDVDPTSLPDIDFDNGKFCLVISFIGCLKFIFR